MKKVLSVKRSSTLFLKFVLFLIAAIVLVALIRFPQTEGRAAHRDLLSIYADPLIIYGYIASIPFFAVLYQAFKLLGYIDKNKAFSELSVVTLKRIKYYALALAVMVFGGLLYIRTMVQGDDPAGVTMVGFVIIFASFVVATFAAVLQKLLQNATDLQSENDLTV
jgi:hypothetical protein